MKVTVVRTCRQSLTYQQFLFGLTFVKWRFSSRPRLYHNHISSFKRSCAPSPQHRPVFSHSFSFPLSYQRRYIMFSPCVMSLLMCMGLITIIIWSDSYNISKRMQITMFRQFFEKKNSNTKYRDRSVQRYEEFEMDGTALTGTARGCKHTWKGTKDKEGKQAVW
jgi:hypothetical protein